MSILDDDQLLHDDDSKKPTVFTFNVENRAVTNAPFAYAMPFQQKDWIATRLPRGPLRPDYAFWPRATWPYLFVPVAMLLARQKDFVWLEKGTVIQAAMDRQIPDGYGGITWKMNRWVGVVRGFYRQKCQCCGWIVCQVIKSKSIDEAFQFAASMATFNVLDRTEPKITPKTEEKVIRRFRL